MKKLRQRLLYAVLKKRKRPYDRTIIYLLHYKFLEIRKQKDRRRRRVLARIWRASQLAMLKRMYSQTI